MTSLNYILYVLILSKEKGFREVKITTVKKWFTYSASVTAFLMAVSIFSPRKANSSCKGTPIRTPLSSPNLQWASEILNNKKIQW